MSNYTNDSSDAVDQEVEVSLPGRYMTGHVTVKYFSDSALSVPVTPTEGEIDLYGKLSNTDLFIPLATGKIDCTTEDFATWRGSLVGIKAVPTGIVGAAYYSITIVGEDHG